MLTDLLLIYCLFLKLIRNNTSEFLCNLLYPDESKKR